MTASMIITLAVVVAMVVVIIADKLPFGAPALLACALLVVLNQADVATAFGGFADSNVVMIMGFMVCTAVLQKTAVIYRMKQLLSRIASRGGLFGFILLITAIMAVGNFITGTAYYVLVISIVATIPYNKNLPTSRILLPSAIASGCSSWLPNSAAMRIALIMSLCETAGVQAEVPVAKYCLICFIWSMIYLVYSIVMHRFLPDRDISDAGSDKQIETEFVPVLTNVQQTIVYIGYIVVLVDMVFMSKLPGQIGYAIPLLVAGVYLACGAINFKDMLSNMFSPVLIMMASVIGVAATMSNSGLSAFLGDQIANLMGGHPSLLALVLVFGFMTSIVATFTGAAFGSLFIFAPIGIALCLTYGYDPIPLTFACVQAAWINYVMPIDGMPALAMGTGKYKLPEFWLYVVPMWVLQMFVICGLGVLLF